MSFIVQVRRVHEVAAPCSPLSCWLISILEGQRCLSVKPVWFLNLFLTILNTAGALLRKAEMYLEYMKHIPIPECQNSIIPFRSWQGLAKSMKELYGQPLHFLTNFLLRNWDISRFGSEDESQPLDMIIHPAKAEATIWIIEEVHRRTTSHQYLAELWASDPMYHAYIDPIFP